MSAAAAQLRQSRTRAVTGNTSKWVWLCADYILFTDTEIYLLYDFTYHKILFLLVFFKKAFKNEKAVLSSKALHKQGWICHDLSTPDLGLAELMDGTEREASRKHATLRPDSPSLHPALPSPSL